MSEKKTTSEPIKIVPPKSREIGGGYPTVRPPQPRPPQPPPKNGNSDPKK